MAQSEFDTAQSAYELAMNRQKVAKGQLVVAQAKVSEAAAQVAQARANLERAEEQLRNATIRAPIAGMVLTRDIEIGSPVSSILNLGANATLVMTLGDIKEVFVRGKVDEADIGQVKYEQHARISVETFKDKKFDGRVTLISPMGAEKDNVTTFEVKVSIDNPGNELKANMTANAEIILEERAELADRARGGHQLRRGAQGVGGPVRSERADRAPQGAGQGGHRQRHARATARRRQEGRPRHPPLLEP